MQRDGYKAFRDRVTLFFMYTSYSITILEVSKTAWILNHLNLQCLLTLLY